MHVTSCIERASTVGRRVEAAGIERRSASKGVVLKADAAATRVATRATATLTCIEWIPATFGALPKVCCSRLMAAPPGDDRLRAVRDSTEWVCARAQHVRLDRKALSALASELAAHRHKLCAGTPLACGEAASMGGDVGWGDNIHFVGSEEATLEYLLVTDALNFCFWPSGGQWEYEDLSLALKAAVEADSAALHATNLAAMDEERLQALLGGRRLPDMPTRVRHLREVGAGLLANWGGSAAALVRGCNGSARTLVDTVVSFFPGFQDHVDFHGKQVYTCTA